jgi:hypothetical protein
MIQIGVLLLYLPDDIVLPVAYIQTAGSRRYGDPKWQIKRCTQTKLGI